MPITRMFKRIIAVVSTLVLSYSIIAPAAAASAADLPPAQPSSEECPWYGSASSTTTSSWSRTDADQSQKDIHEVSFASAPVAGRACGATWSASLSSEAVDVNPGDCPSTTTWTTTGAGNGIGDLTVFLYTRDPFGPAFEGIFNADTRFPLTSTVTVTGCSPSSDTSIGESVYPPTIGVSGCGGVSGNDPLEIVSYDVQAVAGVCIVDSEDSDPSIGYVIRTQQKTTWKFRRTVCDVAVDSDGDNLADCTEFDLSTDPSNPDTDGDGFRDGADHCPAVAGTANGCAAEDTDSDGILDSTDNCRSIPNPGQADLDADSLGDVCDSDIDGDGLDNTQESSAGTSPTNPDTDADAVLDGSDACPLVVGTAANHGCPEECRYFRSGVTAEAGTATSSLFAFDVTAIYGLCTSAAGQAYVSVRNVEYDATALAGVTAGILQSLGFTTRETPDSTRLLATEVRPGGVVIAAQSQLDMCFDFATLVDKIGLKEKAEKIAAKKISLLIAKYGKGREVQLATSIRAVLSDLKRETDIAVAKAFSRLKQLSPDQGEELHLIVQTKVDEQFLKLNKVVDSLLDGGSVVQKLKSWLSGGGISTWLTELATVCFPVWQPLISITVPYANGIASAALYGFQNPIFGRASITKDEFIQLP